MRKGTRLTGKPPNSCLIAPHYFVLSVRRHPSAHRCQVRPRRRRQDPHLGPLQPQPAEQGKEHTKSHTHRTWLEVALMPPSIRRERGSKQPLVHALVKHSVVMTTPYLCYDLIHGSSSSCGNFLSICSFCLERQDIIARGRN